MRKVFHQFAAVALILSLAGFAVAGQTQSAVNVLKDGGFYSSVIAYQGNSSSQAVMKVSANKSSNSIRLNGEVVATFYFDKNLPTVDIVVIEDITLLVEWHCSSNYARVELIGAGTYSLPQLFHTNGRLQDFNQIWILGVSENNQGAFFDADLELISDDDFEIVTQYVRLEWARSGESRECVAIRPITNGEDAFDYFDIWEETPLRFFETEAVRAIANAKADAGLEFVQAEARQITDVNNIWDSGAFFNYYKNMHNPEALPYQWASWEHFGQDGYVACWGTMTYAGDYTIRRFTTYFDLSAELYDNLESAVLAPENNEGKMSYFFPINDSVFVFVNGQLAFWGGTDHKEGENVWNAHIRSQFEGKDGLPVMGGDNTLYQEFYPHTDGWCIDLAQQKEYVDISRFLVVGENAIDVIVDDYWEGGGMNKLALFVEVRNINGKFAGDDNDNKVVLSGLNWNNGNTSNKDGANGAGLIRFEVDGVTFRNNRNYITPDNFMAAISVAPGNNGNPNIYTVLERTVTIAGVYVKVYDVMVAIFADGDWNVYAGTITVDNPGGNDNNQKIEIYRIM